MLVYDCWSITYQLAEPKNMGNGITYITEIIPYIIPVLHCMKHWSSFLLFLPPCLSREKHEIGYFFLRLFWMFEHLQRSTSFWDGICRKNDLQSATYLLRSGWKWYQEWNHIFPLCISHFKWLIFLYSLDCLYSWYLRVNFLTPILSLSKPYFRLQVQF